MYHKNGFATDFQKKAELFNSLFADQYSLISNSNELPSKLEHFSKNDIAKMIENLNPNKAHGHDQISIRMLNFVTSISNPLEIIFNQCLKAGVFPNDFEKGNVTPVFKKLINKFSKTPCVLENI